MLAYYFLLVCLRRKWGEQMIDLVSSLMSNLGYIYLAAFILSKSKLFKYSIKYNNIKKSEVFMLALIFGLLGIMSTYLGVPYSGSIVNIRNASIIVASMTCGPLVGTIAGLIAGIHRLFYSYGRDTAIACSIATILAGFLPALIIQKSEQQNKYAYSICSIILVESTSMIIIGFLSEKSAHIVANIFVPMIFVNSIAIIMFMSILDSIKKEREKIEGKQAKITLNIANETIPYLTHVNERSLTNVCEIIRESLKAELVVITDEKNILAYSSKSNKITIKNNIISKYTKKVILNNKTIILNKNKEDFYLEFDSENTIKSAIITPLFYDGKVLGALKVYFKDEYDILESTKNIVLGLSTLISVQLQLSKVKDYENMANKAEIKALQAQINPHFLFNALHTIAAFVRSNSEEARELIVDLSQYLRYNLEFKNDLIELESEIEHIKYYVSIQRARFGNKINIHYKIKERYLKLKIPELILEPLVENAIKHGILKNKYGGNVWISVKKNGKNIILSIEDDGVGIDKSVIEDIESENLENKSVGLNNVYRRVKIIYGHELKIERLRKGTRVSIIIENDRDKDVGGFYELYNS